MSPDDFNEITVFDDAADNMDIIKTIINMKNQEDAFYIVDIGDIVNKHCEWITKMPRVAPHYGTSALRTYVARQCRLNLRRKNCGFSPWPILSKLISAVKCNPDPNVIKILAALNTGFDCASEVIHCAFYAVVSHCQSLGLQYFKHWYFCLIRSIMKSPRLMLQDFNLIIIVRVKFFSLN